MDDPNLFNLVRAAEALGDLRESLVFVGGCSTGLLLTTARSHPIRVTEDVDVVAEVTSYRSYHALEKLIAGCGFVHDQSPEAPICRWLKDDIKLDVMPTEPGILGFHNRWYPLAVATANPIEIPGDMMINLISAPVFIATKLEALHGRGKDDYLLSHDLEDIISVIDGRPEIIKEAKESDQELRNYLSEEFHELINDPGFVEALPGKLPGDNASQSRVPIIIERLKDIAGINS